MRGFASDPLATIRERELKIKPMITKESVFKFPQLTTTYRCKDGKITAGFIAASMIERKFKKSELRKMTIKEVKEIFNEAPVEPKEKIQS